MHSPHGSYGCKRLIRLPLLSQYADAWAGRFLVLELPISLVFDGGNHALDREGILWLSALDHHSDNCDSDVGYVYRYWIRLMCS